MAQSMDIEETLTLGRSLVQPPTKEDVTVMSPEEVVTRLNSIGTPKQQIWELFKAVIDPTKETTHESFNIRRLALIGFAVGSVYCGVLQSVDIHEEYARKHNASVFDNAYRGNRHFWDTLISNIASRGIKYGIRMSIIGGLTGFISYSSIVVRNELYLPDWIISYSALGALTRLWLGSRAMGVGAGLGAIVGLICYGGMRFSEKLSGYSIAQQRLIQHGDWLTNHEALLRKMQSKRQETVKTLLEDFSYK